MKKILVATAVALALSATAANAASTAVLKVTGLLSVAACTPQTRRAATFPTPPGPTAWAKPRAA